MIEVQVPKDVSVYESPLVGPLTARQTVCVAVAAAIEYVYYNIVQTVAPNIDMNTLICVGMLFAVPVLYLAVGKPYGMKPETYVSIICTAYTYSPRALMSLSMMSSMSRSFLHTFTRFKNFSLIILFTVLFFVFSYLIC